MPISFNDRILDEIRNSPRNTIVEVISEHLRLDRKGKDFVGLCPFHSDTRPSMYVSPSKGIFKCFACGAGGDAFKFLQLREGLSFPQAVERLAQRAQITLEQTSHSRAKKQSPDGLPYAEPAEIAKANERAFAFWKDLYSSPKGAIAREYVASRGISEQMAEQWGLGFAPDSWDSLGGELRRHGINDELLVASGLVVRREESGRVYDKFRNRLMFPIWDTTGRVIAFGGRTLGDDPAKYMNSPATSLFDKSRALYGLDKARHEIVSEGKAVVVEGYTDVMMAHQFGIKNVVAALGTSFTSSHAAMLKRFAAEVVLVLDSDIAGEAAAERALDICIAETLEVKVAMVSEGKDPCDFLLAAGAEPFKNIISSATDAMSYKWQKFTKKFTPDTPIAEKRLMVKEFIDSIGKAISAGAVDTVAKSLFIQRLSSLTGMEISQINRHLSKSANKNAVIKHDEHQQIVKIAIGANYLERAQKEVIEAIVNLPELFAGVETRFGLSFFTSPALKQIAQQIVELWESGSDFNVSSLLARLEQPEVAAFVVELVDTEGKKRDYARQLRQALLVLEENEQTSSAKTQAEQEDDLNKYLEAVRSKHIGHSKINMRSGIMI